MSTRANLVGSSITSAGYPITASGAVDRDYTITYLPGTLVVKRAPLTITADNATKMYGDAAGLDGTEFTETGLVPATGDTITSVTLNSPGSARSAPAGTYSIVPHAAVGNGLSNYAITYVSGTLTVIAPPLVTLHSVSIQKIKVKRKTSEVIVLQFSAALNVNDARNVATYALVTNPKSKKQKSTAVALANASYNPSTFAVTLTTRKPLVLNPPLKLTIRAASLLDALGRPLASDVVAKLTTGSATITRTAKVVEARRVRTHH